MKRYHHNPEQFDALQKDLTAIGQRLLAIGFENPADDQQMIRHHAYLRGKFDQLKDLLEDNYPDPTQPKE